MIFDDWKKQRVAEVLGCEAQTESALKPICEVFTSEAVELMKCAYEAGMAAAADELREYVNDPEAWYTRKIQERIAEIKKLDLLMEQGGADEQRGI